MRSIRTPPGRPRTPRRRRSGSSTHRLYAEALPTTFDHLDLRAVLVADADAVLSAEVRFLAPTGERHQAQAHTVSIPGVMVGALTEMAVQTPARFEGTDGRALSLTVRLAAASLGGDELRDLREGRERHARLQWARSRRGAALLADLGPPDRAGARRAVHLAARAAVHERQHLSGAGERRGRRDPGRGDHAERPPSDRAREPRLAVRRHRDRGGAAAARARAERR